MLSFFKQFKKLPMQNGFSTQSQISKDAAIEEKRPDEKLGLCQPWANLYTKYQLGKISHSFMEGPPSQMYKHALKEHEEEKKLIAANKDGRHHAFIATNTPYSIWGVPLKELKTPNGVKNIIQYSPHALITFPAATESNEFSWHQVAVGKDKNPNQCYVFDANQQGGEKVGPCPSIFADASEIFKNHSDDHDMDFAIVGGENAPRP